LRRPRLGSLSGDADTPWRRRLTGAGGLLLVALVTAAVMVAIASGGGSPHPQSQPVGAVSVITGPTPPNPTNTTQRKAPPFTPDPRATAVANTLPLPAQVAQLFMVSVDGTGTPAAAGLGLRGWGGVVLDSSNSGPQLGALTSAIVAGAKARGAPPPLIAAAQPGGPGTAFPHLAPESEPAVAATGDAATARTQALLAARQLRAVHVNMTLAPLADVDIPSGSLTGKLFGDDPNGVARFTAAAVNGYYDGDLISAVGHFPGEGAASSDPDQTPGTVGGSLAQLRTRDLIPFAAVAARTPVILMSNAAYAAFDGVTPASLLPQAVSLLRDSYGFGGVVMSDDLDATLQPTGDGPGSVAVQALDAGDDLLYITGPPSEHQAAYAAVLAAAQKSATERARVRSALLRDLSLKARYGLLG
jgi:beta-N-acetylhexosaminidase